MNFEGVVCFWVGLEYLCGNLLIDCILFMWNIWKDFLVVRVGDGCSDDDVIIVGVFFGNRYNMIDFFVVDFFRKLEILRCMLKNFEIFSVIRLNFVEFGSLDELGFLGLWLIGIVFEFFNNEDFSLVLYLMNIFMCLLV